MGSIGRAREGSSCTPSEQAGARMPSGSTINVCSLAFQWVEHKQRALERCSRSGRLVGGQVDEVSRVCACGGRRVS